jgi:hypothetical protein
VLFFGCGSGVGAWCGGGAGFGVVCVCCGGGGLGGKEMGPCLNGGCEERGFAGGSCTGGGGREKDGVW